MTRIVIQFTPLDNLYVYPNGVNPVNLVKKGLPQLSIIIKECQGNAPIYVITRFE